MNITSRRTSRYTSSVFIVWKHDGRSGSTKEGKEGNDKPKAGRRREGERRTKTTNLRNQTKREEQRKLKMGLHPLAFC